MRKINEMRYNFRFFAFIVNIIHEMSGINNILANEIILFSINHSVRKFH